MNAPLADRDDAVLAMLALGGDQRGYAELLRRHREVVYRLVRAQTDDPAEALDLTQESFVAAFAALGRYDPQRPFRHWILRIALNKCRDWARRRAVRRLFVFARPIEEALTVADGGPDPEQSAHSARELARIHRAIADLPVRLREVLLLRAVDGMGQAEAAQLLGISEKAVETRLYRARLKLAERLQED